MEFSKPVIEGDSVYWIGVIDGGNSAQLELWRYDLGISSAQFELFRSVEIDVAGATSVPLFDVDGHYFASMIESFEGDRRLVLFDSDTDNAQLIEIDILPYELACCAGTK